MPLACVRESTKTSILIEALSWVITEATVQPPGIWFRAKSLAGFNLIHPGGQHGLFRRRGFPNCRYPNLLFAWSPLRALGESCVEETNPDLPDGVDVVRPLTPHPLRAKEPLTRSSQPGGPVYDRCTIESADGHFWHFVLLLECASYTI